VTFDDHWGVTFVDRPHATSSEISAWRNSLPAFASVLADWGTPIGDVPAAATNLDGFLPHADIIGINGRSYRLQGPRPAGG